MDAAFYRKYHVLEELGKGSFGCVKRAVMLPTNKQVAIKFEEIKPEKRQVLQTEVDTLHYLQGGPGIPVLHGSGNIEGFNYLVEELLGLNLATLLKSKKKFLSPGFVAKLAEQMITTLKFMHSRGYLHRDIKPQNFCMSLEDTSSVFLTDFGLAKKFLNEKLHIHSPYREDLAFVGTASFASLNAHLGVQQSRRDDLESLLLVLMYLTKGKLPWQAVKYRSDLDKQIAIRMQKLLITAEELCKGLPEAFLTSFRYVRGLSYEEKPDYELLRKQFKGLRCEDSMLRHIAMLPENERLKRSFKTHKHIEKIVASSISIIGSPRDGGLQPEKQDRIGWRLPSCPPKQAILPRQEFKEMMVSPVRGHSTRSLSVGILPQQPLSSSQASDSSECAHMESEDLSSTLKGVAVAPINRCLLVRIRYPCNIP